MRTGLSTIQQTLTPEASSVLNQSIAEAGRRNHSQTTPLHVAATLLASPSGFLRQACIKSHPNSSHPLQCRALELCFRVALDRLPTAQNMNPATKPPMSHALMAALKRAQSHQRRGCPEQQQQPLLAVKVELEQLIISILDDPSVSRVMREASFSSPAVKATIEQSLNSSPSPTVNSNSMGLGFRPTTVSPAAVGHNRNMYLNPRLQQPGSTVQLGQQRGEEVNKVVDILLRTKKRNPILVGESEPEAIVKDLLKRIENREMGDGVLCNVHVIHLEIGIASDNLQIPTKIKELGDLVETRMVDLNCKGVIINLGDLKWLVEQPVGLGVAGSGNILQQAVTEVGRAGVVEMRKLLERFGESSTGRLWLIGTATCETYLRCQVYHPSMENDWDLQAVPLASRPHMSGMFSRTNGILGSSLESLSAMKGFPTKAITQTRHAPENLDPSWRTMCCPQCMHCYEQELGVVLKELEKSASEVKTEATRPSLPQWLQNAKTDNNDTKSDEAQFKNHEMISKKTQELQKKWKDSCVKLHPNFHQQNLSSERITPTAFSMTGLCSPNLLGGQPSQPKLHLNKTLGRTLLLKPSAMLNQSSDKVASPPASPVRTDLVLGQRKVADANSKETHEHGLKDFLGFKASEPQNKVLEWKSNKFLGTLDADSYKQLVKSLTKKVWWQIDAASAVATTVTQCKLGNGKRRGAGNKGDMWLLFMGPDRVGKRKMAAALSEHVSASNSIIISLGSQRGYLESDVSLRGKTALDKIAEAVRRNPFSVILLEDIDEADILLRGSLKRAMDRGRLNDAHGREISLGNVIFILTANYLPANLKYLSNGISFDEDKLASLALGGWQLKLSLSEKAAKRRVSWLTDEDRQVKPRKGTGTGLGFDLNEAANAEDDHTDGSHNSSDLTVDHEDDHSPYNMQLSMFSSLYGDLLDGVDDTIIFRPVDLDALRHSITNFISKRFCSVLGNGVSIEVEDGALEKISSGVWLGQAGSEEWIEKVLVPSFYQLKKHLCNTPCDDSVVVTLELDSDSGSRRYGDWLPSSARVVAGGS